MPDFRITPCSKRRRKIRRCFSARWIKVGTIEKGKRADLILLDANPLENISNTEKRSGVMLKGKYYTQAEMNKWLDEIAPRIANSHIEKNINSMMKIFNYFRIGGNLPFDDLRG